jgi:hypothetical protein
MPEQITCVEIVLNGTHRLYLTNSPKNISESCTPGKNMLTIVNELPILLSTTLQVELKATIDIDRWVQKIPRDINYTLDLSILSFSRETEQNVEIVSVKNSNICPITLQTINISVRGNKCKHAQTFDARSYLLMCSQIDVWKCPLCG